MGGWRRVQLCESLPHPYGIYDDLWQVATKSTFFVTFDNADEDDCHAWVRLMAVALMFVAA